MDLLEATLWRLTGEAMAIHARTAPNSEIHLLPHAAMILSGEVVLNQILLPPVVGNEEHLRRFCAIARARRAAFTVVVSAESESLFAPAIAELGLQRDKPGRLMVAQPQESPGAPSTYQGTRIEREEQWQQAYAILARAFGVPPRADGRYWAWPFGADAAGLGGTMLDGPGFTSFLAYHAAGTPVSTVQAHTAGSAAGIWAMATSPEEQRKGAGRAVLEHCMAFHLQRGVRLFYMWADVAGYLLYERLGYRTVAEVTTFVWRPES